MKKNQKDFSIYIIMLVVFGLLIFIGLKSGASLHPSADILHPETSSFVLFFHTMKENLGTSLMVLLIQIIIILFACRLFSFLFNKIGQPSVIGEIMAGIILGPSFFGYFFPDTFNLVFSKDSLVYIKLLSHIGLILFMFVIGLEVDFKVLKNKINETLVISHAGILAPFLLGIVASFFVYKEYASAHTGFVPFALFIGISMSITAFPVLARIVQEKGFMDTPLGALTIASAANDDVTAWCLLAVVIAIAKAGTVISSLYAVVCTVLYILFMFLAVRPFFKKIGTYYINRETINKNFISFAFLSLILSAALTQLIGIHALFGAFVAGVVMPPELNFRRIMIDKIEDVALVFFLPLFFAYTGLNTNVLLINSWSMVLVCVLFIAFAVLGKFGGCAVSAKLVGESWHDSLIIGILMNTRGLMELVALNIGYEMGILSKSVFAVLVIMALVTTFMTTPALNLMTRFYSKEKQIPQEKHEKLMFSFADSYSGLNFLSIIQLIFGHGLSKKKIIASHFIQDADLNMITAEHYFHNSFTPLMTESQKRQIPITKYYRLTENITNEIINTVKEEGVDYLFIGSASGRIGKQNGHQGKKINLFRWSLRHIEEKSLSLSGIVITDKTREILNRVNCMVFVAVGAHRIDSIQNVSIIVDKEEDVQLLDYAENILPLVRSLHVYLSVSVADLEKVNKINQKLLENPRKVSVQQYQELTGLQMGKYKKHLIISSCTIYKFVLKLYKNMKKQSLCLFVRYRREEIEDKN
ncbi:MAG: cation:proton antiporter [Prevotella sp.]|jgi:Kef-type K+ transport system membrane component KefB|nr:cation:proton antiporter [Prevotella sp.]